MFNMSDGVDEIELMSRMESEIFNVFVGFCWFLLAILLVFVGRKDFRVLLSRDIFLTHIDLQNAQPTTYYLLAFACRIRAELFGLGPNAPRRWQLTSAN